MENKIQIVDKKTKSIKKNKTKSRFNTSRLVMSICITSIMLALAVVLDLFMKFIPFLNMPQGGHITIAIIPLVLIGLLCGPVYGFFGCTLFGVLNFFMDGLPLNAWSIILDYILAFGFIGLSGFFHPLLFKKRHIWVYYVSLVVASLSRYLFSGISGAVIFGMYAPEGVNPWFYSFVLYNAGYIFASLGVSLVIISALFYPIDRLIRSYNFRPLQPKFYINEQDNLIKLTREKAVNETNEKVQQTEEK